jgi:hypothetical protein
MHNNNNQDFPKQVGKPKDETIYKSPKIEKKTKVN